MTAIAFTLDGRDALAQPGESIWDVAKRLGRTLPHLCHCDRPGYRPDGNCRACVVEVEGERTLTAACVRKPTAGMVVRTASARAENARRMVLELLTAEQAPQGRLAEWVGRAGLGASRFPAESQAKPATDASHAAIVLDHTACIQCGLCLRACREVQHNDVIGLALRGAGTRVVFDLDRPMGASTCVGCGECVQACPTGAFHPAVQVQAERVVDSLCPYCGVGCQVHYHVQGERVVAVSGRDGPANRGRLCVKGRFGVDYIHHPHRLTQPLVRIDGVAKDPLAAVDPAHPGAVFRPASWDEALDRAATGFKAILAGPGGQALAGLGSAKGSNEEAYLFQKLVRTGFGTNNVDHCTRLCHASSVTALIEGIGSGAVTAPVMECLNSEVIVLVGCNPAANHPVAATFIKDAVSRGATLIIMDPRGGRALSRYADEVLPFRPGTDVTLLNALINVVVTEGLADQAYLAAHTEGFDALAAHVVPYTPEAMAPVCGIPADTIRRVARRFATARAAMIFWGMGVSQHVHGTDNVRCLIALALACGQVGRPGAGLHPLRGQNNVQGASDSGLIPMFYPDYRQVTDPAVRQRFEGYWGATLDPRRGLTVVEMIDAANAGTLRGMYIMGENPAMSDPDLTHARAGLATLDHLVVQDLFLTETAMLADVVLPASALPEKDGTFTNTDRRVQMGRAAVPPPGQARQDLWIIQELARRLGLDWSYAGPRAVFDEMLGCLPSWRGLDWERLERDGAVTYPLDPVTGRGREILFGDGFPMPGGKARLIPAAPLPPDEIPDHDYPLVLTTGRLLEHWHTGAMTRRAAALDQLEPAALVMASPPLLARLGVKSGEMVRVATRRGTVEVAARADAALPDDLLFMPFCFAEGAANMLTNPALDPFARIPELKYCAARLEQVRNNG